MSYDKSWHGLSCSCGGGWLIGHHHGCPEDEDYLGYARDAIKADIKQAKNNNDHEQVKYLEYELNKRT